MLPSIPPRTLVVLLAVAALLAACNGVSSLEQPSTELPPATLAADPPVPDTPSPEPTVSAPVPDGQPATVTAVIDGDTIDVELNGREARVRYIGIDTPERGDPFYEEASQANAALVTDQTVTLVRDVSETDSFGRLLRYVYLLDGTFVNAELVRRGYAFARAFPPDVARQEQLTALEQAAREDGRGLWTAAQGALAITAIHFDGDQGPTEPDEYAVLTNQGDTTVDLLGWRLQAGDAGQSVLLPAVTLAPGESCRVYTDLVRVDSCAGASFESGQAVWRNSGDCGLLYNPDNQLIDRRCYEGG